MKPCEWSEVGLVAREVGRLKVEDVVEYDEATLSGRSVGFEGGSAEAEARIGREKLYAPTKARLLPLGLGWIASASAVDGLASGGWTTMVGSSSSLRSDPHSHSRLSRSSKDRLGVRGAVITTLGGAGLS